MTRRCRWRRAIFSFAIFIASGGRVQTHDGPPYPIVSNRIAGAYDVTIWTDPDATADGTAEGKFWVVLEPSDRARPIPAGTRVSVAITPLDRTGTVQRRRAEPVDASVSRQYAALILDHEGLFAAHVTIEGPLGVATVESSVQATYDLRPQPIAVVAYLLPFLLLGGLWAKVLLRRRRARSSRAG